MTLTETSPRRAQRPGLGVAYLMTGIALACIFVSGLLGAIFTPDMVTGYYHEHLPIAAMTGWIFDAIAISMLAKAALQGIRARVSDPAPWTVLGLGVGAIWLAVMLVSIFAPLSVTGTDPTQIPVWSGLSAIAGIILTGILCNLVKTGSFDLAETRPRNSTTGPMVAAELSADDPMVRLRRLGQLRDSGTITDEEFQAKKTDLLGRI